MRQQRAISRPSKKNKKNKKQNKTKNKTKNVEKEEETKIDDKRRGMYKMTKKINNGNSKIKQ